MVVELPNSGVVVELQVIPGQRASEWHRGVDDDMRMNREGGMGKGERLSNLMEKKGERER
jgi:hypothetical protein